MKAAGQVVGQQQDDRANENMQIYYALPPSPATRPSYLTIGSFDGVHMGHQQMLSEMVEAAHVAGCQAGAITFEPHPVAVLRPQVPLLALSTPVERAEIMAALGLDFVVVLPFTRQTANMTASEFMALLVDRLRLAMLWVGPDFALGRGREGDVARLAEIGSSLGYGIHVAPQFERSGEPVRSSRVRALLTEEGDAERAAELLGRPYQLWGKVEHGVQRGRALGYPTANLSVPPGRLIPAYGVYACWAWLGSEESADMPVLPDGIALGGGPAWNGGELGLPAAVSIGVRPTFDNGRPTVEAYLLDYRGDLYGRSVGLSFVKRLRPELRFAGVDALIAQMERDVTATRTILAHPVAETRSGEHRGWQELRHTADWAIEAHAGSQAGLFAQVAAAMYELQSADMEHPAELARAVAVYADDPEGLLVEWLNRLLLYQELGGELYTRFELNEISPQGARGIAFGYRGAPPHTAIKAVTYYDLAVNRTASGWSARVTFDV